MINPVSGSRKVPAVLRRVQRRLRDAGVTVEIQQTRGPGHARDWAAGLRVDASAAQAVVAVGGDGTVREVVEGLAGKAIPLAVLPTGTENLAAREFGFRLDADVLCERLLRGVPRPVDLAMVNGRAFLVVAGIGFDAEVVERLRAARAGHITHGSYFQPFWRTFWEHRFPRVCVVADGETVHDGPGLVFVGNLPRYAIGLPICPDARWDDGRLDLCVFPCGSRRRLIGHAICTVARWRGGRYGAIRRQCRHIRVTAAERVPMEVDGDPAGALPAEFQVGPDPVTILLAE